MSLDQARDEPLLPPECTDAERHALQALAASRSAGIWRIKRAKLVLGCLIGKSAHQLMVDLRIPPTTIVAFLRRFAIERLAALDHPDRAATAREAAAERLLAFLEDPAPDGSDQWTDLAVSCIGRAYTARDIARLRALIAKHAGANRADLARELCLTFDLRQPNGRLKLAGAHHVLRRLEMDNLIALPPLPRRGRYRSTAPGLLRELSVSPAPEDLDVLRFELVQTGAASRLWRDLLAKHHYIEKHRLYGAQMRYLVYGARARGALPEHLIAVLGFAASAWKLSCRDVFIGWTDAERVANLSRVVGNARFLILPWVRVANLASRILAGVVRQLPGDWERRYGFRPVLLETFVQLDRFRGTCYRAANWIQVGTTRGYSLYGGTRRAAEPRRAVLVYPLRRDFRAVLARLDGGHTGSNEDPDRPTRSPPR